MSFFPTTRSQTRSFAGKQYRTTKRGNIVKRIGYITQPKQQENKTPTLAALGYRLHTGCKQYAFEELESLKRWTKRHPYKNELLRIMLFKDNRMIADRWMPAPEVSDWLDTITASAYQQK